MERNRGLRKACDLCYRKRIKCDAQKPRCSNCIVYDSSCTYVSASRKASSRKKGPEGPEGDAGLQSRVESLEAEVRLLSERIEVLARPAANAQAAQAADATQVSSLATEIEHVRQIGGSSPYAARELPPLHEVLPIVEGYLAISNSILPLFHPATLLDTVKKWYWFPEERDTVTWATINVVLALAFLDAPNPSVSTAEYVNNTQSVLTEVIMGDTGLAGVQVLVGLVMLFQESQDLGPPTMLIATAIRLAHRLGLHTRRSSVNLDRRLALQRSRVFWIAYILDRDLSLRSRQTPVQHEAEIDLDLPTAELGDDQAGCVFTADGLSKIDLFRARVQLARIQGKVYDSLFSVQAQRCSAEERTQSAADIGSMLDDWMSSIPHDFHPRTLLEAGPLAFSRPFCILYSARLMCLCLINRAHPWNSLWVDGIQDYGRSAAAGNLSSPSMLLPLGWQNLVDESRDLMRLFVTVPRKNASFIWLTVCAYISGLMCLVTNIICNPHYQTVEGDIALADAALQFIGDLAKQTSSAMFIKSRDSCTELILHARSIVVQVKDPHTSTNSLCLTDGMASGSVERLGEQPEQTFNSLPPVVERLEP